MAIPEVIPANVLAMQTDVIRSSDGRAEGIPTAVQFGPITASEIERQLRSPYLTDAKRALYTAQHIAELQIFMDEFIANQLYQLALKKKKIARYLLAKKAYRTERARQEALRDAIKLAIANRDAHIPRNQPENIAAMIWANTFADTALEYMPAVREMTVLSRENDKKLIDQLLAIQPGDITAQFDDSNFLRVGSQVYGIEGDSRVDIRDIARQLEYALAKPELEPDDDAPGKSKLRHILENSVNDEGRPSFARILDIYADSIAKTRHELTPEQPSSTEGEKLEDAVIKELVFSRGIILKNAIVRELMVFNALRECFPDLQTALIAHKLLKPRLQTIFDAQLGSQQQVKNDQLETHQELAKAEDISVSFSLGVNNKVELIGLKDAYVEAGGDLSALEADLADARKDMHAMLADNPNEVAPKDEYAKELERISQQNNPFKMVPRAHRSS